MNGGVRDRERRRWHAVAMVVATIVLHAGCDDQAGGSTSESRPDIVIPPESLPPRAPDAGPIKPEIVKDEGPMPAPDVVLASAGDHSITLAEFERMNTRGLLFAPDQAEDGKPPIEWLTAPHMQIQLTRRLLGQKIIVAEAQRRKLEVSDAEIDRYLDAHPRLGSWAKMKPDERDPKLAAIGSSPAELRVVAREELLTEKLRAKLVMEIAEDEVWRDWASRRDTVDLMIVSTPNVPNGDELDAFVDQQTERIEAFFEKNKSRYYRPKMVLVDIVSPKKNTENDYAMMHNAAKELEKGTEVSVVAKNLGFEAAAKVPMVRQENPKAFAAPVGTTGFELDGPRGRYAWRVVGVREGGEGALDRSTRREIAAEIMRTESLTPSVRKRLESARKTLELTKPKAGPIDKAIKKAITKKLAAEGLGFRVTGHLSNSGRLPGFGLAEEVVEAAFKATAKKPAGGPILSRERGFVFYLLERRKPDRKQFEKHKSVAMQAYRESAGAKVIDRLVEGHYGKHAPTMDIKPLRIKYGVMQKPQR